MDSAGRLTAARVAATIVAAVPAIGLGVATLWEALTEGGAASLDRRFHLGLGLALFVLFCEFAVAISRSRSVSSALLLGAAGLAASLAAAITVELFGPAALLVLVAATALGAIRTASVRRSAGAARRASAST